MWIFFRATEKNFGPLFCLITSTVEPRLTQGKELAKSVRYIEVPIHVFYCYCGKESLSLHRGLRYVDVRYNEVPLYSFCNDEWRHMKSVSLEIRTKRLIIHEAV